MEERMEGEERKRRGQEDYVEEGGPEEGGGWRIRVGDRPSNSNFEEGS
jgi:hypothetical protein